MCDAGAAAKLIMNVLASAHGDTAPATFNDSNGPMGATRHRRRANGTVAPATARPTSPTLGRLRRLECLTKTPRDKSGGRSDRFGIHTRQLGRSCRVSCICERTNEFYIQGFASRQAGRHRTSVESCVSSSARES